MDRPHSELPDGWSELMVIDLQSVADLLRATARLVKSVVARVWSND
jgi:hypothetical protein